MPCYNVQCRCGYRAEGYDTRTAAEVVADVHESRDIRRAYRHAADVVAGVK